MAHFVVDSKGGNVPEGNIGYEFFSAALAGAIYLAETNASHLPLSLQVFAKIWHNIYKAGNLDNREAMQQLKDQVEGSFAKYSDQYVEHLPTSAQRIEAYQSVWSVHKIDTLSIVSQALFRFIREVEAIPNKEEQARIYMNASEGQHKSSTLSLWLFEYAAQHISALSDEQEFLKAHCLVATQLGNLESSYWDIDENNFDVFYHNREDYEERKAFHGEAIQRTKVDDNIKQKIVNVEKQIATIFVERVKAAQESEQRIQTFTDALVDFDCVPGSASFGVFLKGFSEAVDQISETQGLKAYQTLLEKRHGDKSAIIKSFSRYIESQGSTPGQMANIYFDQFKFSSFSEPSPTDAICKKSLNKILSKLSPLQSATLYKNWLNSELLGLGGVGSAGLCFTIDGIIKNLDCIAAEERLPLLQTMVELTDSDEAPDEDKKQLDNARKNAAQCLVEQAGQVMNTNASDSVFALCALVKIAEQEEMSVLNHGKLIKNAIAIIVSHVDRLPASDQQAILESFMESDNLDKTRRQIAVEKLQLLQPTSDGPTIPTKKQNLARPPSKKL